MRLVFSLVLSSIVGLGAIIGSPLGSQAQLVREHDAKSLRGFHGNAGTRIKRSFQSDAEARTVLRQILTAAGLAGVEDRITLRASAETPNAEAFIDNNERLIFYNVVFMQDIARKTKDYWSMVAILAHEVGHHVRFHTAIPGRDHEFELEADLSAGFILRRMGATLEQAQVAFRELAPESATASHPGRAQRVQMVTLGWLEGGSNQAGVPAGSARSSDAAEAWGVVKDSPNVAALEAYVARYTDTFFAELAGQRLQELRKSQVAAAEPIKPSIQPPVSVAPARCEGVAVQVKNDTQCLKYKDTFRDCDECPEMIVIPSGEFMMGSPSAEVDRSTDEGPLRRVSVGKPFAAGKFEAKFAEWEVCVTSTDCKHKPGDEGWGRGTLPVINVSWNDAKEYVAWLSRKTGRQYRLLSEAEWEYVARAGTGTPFHMGRMISTDQANFNGYFTYGGSARGITRGKTIEVGSLNSPNAFGVHDMHGNVWEWVKDCYVDSYNGAPTDGSARSSGSCGSRVLRGGSSLEGPNKVRSAFRYAAPPGVRLRTSGFRVARTLD